MIQANYAGEVVFYDDQPAATAKKVTVTADKPLTVTQYESDAVTNYHVQLKQISGPAIELDVTPATLEAGEVQDLFFVATIQKGTEPLALAALRPAGLSFENQDIINMSHGIENVSGERAGVLHAQTAEVVDVLGNKATVTKGVQVLDRFMIGYIPRGFLSTNALVITENGLGKTIQEVFGASREYEIPGEAGSYSHICWLVRAGQVLPAPMTEANFPYQLADPINLVITNAFGAELAYSLYYTKTYFAAGGLATLRIP